MQCPESAIALVSYREFSFSRNARAMKVNRNIVFIPFSLIIGLTVDGFEQPRHAGITMAAIQVSTALGGTASERVPFVGCEETSIVREEEKRSGSRGSRAGAGPPATGCP